jgi:branched-chain amino acid transport system permease protein
MQLAVAPMSVLNTQFGRQLDAIRTNEHRLPCLGFVSPKLMFLQVSGNAVINVIVGGTGTLVGALNRP